jgi:hypothetical protein
LRLADFCLDFCALILSSSGCVGQADSLLNK